MTIKPRLGLECSLCPWRPADAKVSMLDHFRHTHPDAEAPALAVAVMCSCGRTMHLTASRPTGGGHKDWFRCPSCASEGFVKRSRGEASYKTPEAAA